MGCLPSNVNQELLERLRGAVGDREFVLRRDWLGFPPANNYLWRVEVGGTDIELEVLPELDPLDFDRFETAGLLERIAHVEGACPRTTYRLR